MGLPRELWSARLQALAAALLFSTGGAGIKVAAFSGLQVSALRSGIAARRAACCSCAADWCGHRRSWLAGVVYAATVTLFVLSTKLTTAANAIFLQSTAPLYLAAARPAALGEHFRRRDLRLPGGRGGRACSVASWGGRRPPSPRRIRRWEPARPDVQHHVGVHAGRACDTSSATTRARVSGCRRSRSGISSRPSPPCRLHGRFPAASTGEWATIVYLGVCQIGLAYVCLTAAIRHLPALEVSLLLLIEPVLNPVWTWILRGEHPGTWTIVGGAIIVSATALRSLHDARASPTYPAG